MTSFYPVVLRVRDQPCLVVGGGAVAARKAQGLVSCGARLTVVAPEVSREVEEMQDRLAIERRPYRRGEAGAYRLVLAATGLPEVDALVAADAEAAGVWVNVADDPARCSFILPSIHRDGPVTVSVSTGGTSPALAAALRRRLAADLGPGIGILAELLGAARREMAEAGRPPSSVDWASLLDGPLPELVREGRLAEARRLLEQATGTGSGLGPAG